VTLLRSAALYSLARVEIGKGGSAVVGFLNIEDERTVEYMGAGMEKVMNFQMIFKNTI
jgi:hypothetical protein